MKPLHEILAKSNNYGGLTLLDHTRQVVQAIGVFAQNYNWDFDVKLVKKGAILHDLGKAHPHFQRKIQEANGETLSNERDWSYPHRHEISSLGFLPIFSEDDWPVLIDLVIAHHKSIRNDPAERGILDLMDRDRNTINNHLFEWKEWSKYGLQILKLYEVPTRTISYEEAEIALNKVVEYCEKKKKGWSPLRGLIRSADHFASAFTHETSKKLESLFEIPDIGFYFQENRKNDLFPLSEISTDDQRPHTLVVAPTGAGKTDFLLKRTRSRIFYTLPFQASINAMWERMKETIPNKDIRLLHSTSKIVVRGKVDEKILQPMPGSAVKVLTPHQLAAIVFGTSGFETMMLDLKNADIILDEIHTYSDFSRSMVLEIVKALLRLNCRIHIGTATMPSILYKQLKNILGGREAVYEIKLSDSVLDTYDRHQVFKIEKEEIFEILENAFEAEEKVLVVYNTVKKAQAFYESILEAFPSIPKMLIHSRFRRGDRVKLEKQLKTEFNGNGESSKEGLAPCIVVSTQVVEVSLDISFDRMITECAPLDGLIQRFGRINRKRNKHTIGKYKPVHVVRPQGNVLPYNMATLKASYDQLPGDGNILHERSLQAKIDEVFRELDTKSIDIHLIYQDGRYKITELTNHKKAVLVEALEIESATCILKVDEEAYLTAKWEDRLPLEIPVNWKTISRYSSQYHQLEVGSYPFVIPQDMSEYQKWGLKLVEPSNFI